MIAHRGHGRVRDQLLLIVVFFVASVTLVVSSASHARADQRSEIDAQADNATDFGFNRTYVYHSQTKDLSYTSDLTTHDVRFLMKTVDQQEPREISWVKVKTDVDDAYVLWRLNESLTTEGEVYVETQVVPGAPWVRVDQQGVAVYDDPTLELQDYGGEARGGPSLKVIGTIEGIREDTAVDVRLMQRQGDVSTLRTELSGVTVRGENRVLGNLSLSDVASGSYYVELVARDGEADVASVQQGVTIKTDVPYVKSIGLSLESPIEFTAFTITGLVDGLDLKNGTLLLGGVGYEVAINPDGTFSHTFDTGLAAGDYAAALVLKDKLENTNEFSPAKQGTLNFTVQKNQLLPGAPNEPLALPVLMIPSIPRVAAPNLSTDFSPQTSRRLASVDVAGATDTDVLGKEIQTLERVINTRPDVRHATPLTPTSSGWSLFGLAWYWWASGVATVWLSVAGARTWLRRS